MFDTGGDDSQLSIDAVQQALAPILANTAITKYMHNAKFDMAVLERYAMPVAEPIFDSMVAAWLTNNTPGAKYGLKALAQDSLNIRMTPITDLIGTGRSQITMAEVSIEKTTPYASADVDMTLRLSDQLLPALEEEDDRLRHLFYDIEMPLIFVLKDMELAGIKVDVAVLKDLSRLLASRAIDLEQAIHEQAGQVFNINSTQQLSDVLFKHLALPAEGLRKTKSGHYSTAAGVLESMAGQHAIIDLILEYRTLSKLQSTYVDSLPKLVNPKTGRIHTNYNQIGISTGRLSSADPNLQNIPIRTPQGREIRRAFVAEAGWKLLAADYSQVELRIMAHMADDPGLKAAFARDEDIHAATAAAVLGVPLDKVDGNQRRIAKTVNFGLAYGQGAFGLARTTGLSVDEARAFIDTYFASFPGVKSYIDDTKKMAAEQAYVETLLGRRRNFPGLENLPGPQRARAEREAINMPIQGTAADIMKLAMINLHRELARQNLKARMLLQVHDEVVLEVPDEELSQVAPLVRQVMVDAYHLAVPLKVDVEVGQNWLEMEKG